MLECLYANGVDDADYNAPDKTGKLVLACRESPHCTRGNGPSPPVEVYKMEDGQLTLAQ